MSATILSNAEVGAALDEAKAEFAAARPRSRAVYERAAAHLPGGNTRTGGVQ